MGSVTGSEQNRLYTSAELKNDYAIMSLKRVTGARGR